MRGKKEWIWEKRCEGEERGDMGEREKRVERRKKGEGR